MRKPRHRQVAKWQAKQEKTVQRHAAMKAAQRPSKVRADSGLKEVRDLFNSLNKQMREFDAEGLTSNDLNLYRDMLEKFYKDNDLDVKHPDQFTTQKMMTQEQADELFDIAYQMANDPYTDLGTYKDMMDMSNADWSEVNDNDQTKYDKINMDAFQKITERYGNINTTQDYVDFIDRMNNFKSNALLSQILDSDQVAELYSLGSWQGLSAEDIDSIIAMEYSVSGRTKDRLYETILEAIELYDEEDAAFYGGAVWKD